MFNSKDKENSSTDASVQKPLKSPFTSVAESPLRRPLHDWNHSEVSPLARPEISGISLRGWSSSRYSTKNSGLKSVPQRTFDSPIQCVTRMSPNLSMLPKYSTPPSQLKDFVVSNPFEIALKETLQMPVYSPSLFQKVCTPKQDASLVFSWSIDEISALNPAPIEEDLVTSQHFEVEFSPETESKAQQMIDSYFSLQHNIMSPWHSESEKKRPSILAEPEIANWDEGGDEPTSIRSVGCQTALSLPPILPAEVEDVLRPYFMESKNLVSVEIEDSDDSNLDVSTCSLRRRLFQDDLTRHNMEFSPGGTSSPIKCGTVVPSHTLRPVTMRSYGTPLPGSSQLTSPGFSPMRGSPSHLVAGPMRRISRAKSKTRLDFSQDCMSVDVSFASQDMSVELATDSPVKDNCRNITSSSTGHQVTASPPSGLVMNPFAFSKDSSISDEESHSFTERPHSPRPNQDTGFSFSASSIFSSTNVHVEEPNRLESIQLHKGQCPNLFNEKRDESVWEPSSKHIVSSTPAKVSP